MSASPIFTSAALSRPFIFSPLSSALPATDQVAKKKPARTTAEILAAVGALPRKLTAVLPASQLEVRATPEMISSGIPQLDELVGGFPRGCLTEICGAASSGRTSVLLSALARATQRGEVCALVDASDTFNPASAVAAGMEFTRLLWVRCGKSLVPGQLTLPAECANPRTSYQSFSGISKFAENKFGFSRWESQLGQMLKVADLLLQSNGFGMIALDLGDIPTRSARQIPLASWFRFRRAVEHTPTSLLVLEQQPIAGSCSSVLLKISTNKLPAVRRQISQNSAPHLGMSHSELLDKLEITAELLRSRLERKPVRPATTFTSRAAWAG